MAVLGAKLGVPGATCPPASSVNERSAAREKAKKKRLRFRETCGIEVPPDEMNRLAHPGLRRVTYTCDNLSAQKRHQLPRWRNPFILQRKQRSRITDGTENPSPVGESRSLMVESVDAEGCGCQQEVELNLTFFFRV
jgi:hypothetical protein